MTDTDLDQCITTLADAANMTRAWYTLDDGLRVHVLTRATTGSNKELVLIHGVISSSIHVMHMAAKIPDTYTVHIIDLPGYGISDNLSLSQPPEPVRLLEMYADVVAATIRHCCSSSSVHLTGHSFGAMIAIYTQQRHPVLVGEMTLLKPAGLFPTLNAFGFYYGIVFSLGWVQSVLKHVPGIRSLCCRRMASSPLSRFTLLTLTHPSSNAYMNPACFITFQGRRVIWNTPCIRQLCMAVASGCKTRVFFAEHDPLIPVDQATLLADVFDGYKDGVLAGEGHQLESSGYVFLPENTEKGVLLPSAKSRRLMEAREGGSAAIHIYGGTPSLTETEANRQRYYDSLRGV